MELVRAFNVSKCLHVLLLACLIVVGSSRNCPQKTGICLAADLRMPEKTAACMAYGVGLTATEPASVCCFICKSGASCSREELAAEFQANLQNLEALAKALAFALDDTDSLAALFCNGAYPKGTEVKDIQSWYPDLFSPASSSAPVGGSGGGGSCDICNFEASPIARADCFLNCQQKMFKDIDDITSAFTFSRMGSVRAKGTCSFCA